jgi:glycosyltransferase involved in cell wall biosynthesis
LEKYITPPPPPPLSVLMPAYNAEKYIAGAIESVLNQTFTDFELLIINDGSTDRTEEIILSFQDKRIRYIKNESNLKLIATLNKGIELACGKYIARMDADDVSLPHRFEKQIAFLEKHSDYTMCGSWAYLIDDKENKTGRVKYIDTNWLLHISLLFSVPFIHPSVMIQTDVLQQYKYNPEALHNEDFDLWLRLAADGLKMANIPEFLLKYRWHDSNISVKYKDEQNKKKQDLLNPYLQSFIGNPISEEAFALHEFSFRLYHLGERKKGSSKNLQAEKKWLQALSQRNQEVKKYPQPDFDAFLWSRWIICAIFAKKYFSIFNIKLAWFNPSVIHKTIKLLLYK